MATNQAFAQWWTVTLASGQTKALTPAQMALRNKNIKTQESYVENTSILKDKAPENGWVLSNGAQTVTPTVEATPTNIDPLQQATLNIWEAQKEALDANAENEKAYTDNYNANLAQIEESKKENLASAEQYFNENEKLIAQAGNEINAIEQGQISSYEDRINRDTALINSKKASEVALLQAEANKQKVDNENAIKEARYNVEIQRQQSAWAYNKIGLSMSSGIINQSQQIATQGIAKIAEIRAMMSYQEATIDAKVADVEFSYTKLVNDTIDKYSDAISGIKKDMIERISDTKKDMIKNSYDKRTTIQEIKDWAIEEKQKADRQHIEDITKVKDRGIALQKDIQKTVEEYQTRELTKLDTMMRTGTITRLSPIQIAQKERELGLPAGTIDAQVDIWITQDIRKQYDAVLWEDYFIENITTLTNDVRNEMKQWRTMEQALQTVIARDLKDNPTYAQMQEARQSEAQLEQAKKQAEIDKIYWDMERNSFEASTWRMNAETARQKLTAEAWTITSTSPSAWISPSGQALIRTASPSWSIMEYGIEWIQWKKVVLDSRAWDAISPILSSEMFKWVVVWSAYRSTEEQAKLYDELSAKWATVAKPWQSAHEKGMAIDLYADGSFNPLNPEQVQAMNDAWWYQNAGAWDLWHFEYLWQQIGAQDKINYLTEQWVVVKNKATQQEIDALYNKQLKTEWDSIIKSYKSWEASIDDFNADFSEEINKVTSNNKDTIKDGFSQIFADFESKWISKDVAKAYLIKAWIISEWKKGTWTDLWVLDTNRKYYIDGDTIKRADKMWDTVVYNLK